jgi:hypothetical protein
VLLFTPTQAAHLADACAAAVDTAVAAHSVSTTLLRQ